MRARRAQAMNGRKSREIRKAANEAANIVGVEAAGALEKLVRYTVSIDERAQRLEVFVARPFLGRLRWLLTGR